MRHRETRWLAIVAASWLAASAPAAAEPLRGPALDARVQELDGQIRDLRAESEKISGTPAPREGKKKLENELLLLKHRQEQLHETIERSEGSAEDLAAYRQEFADGSVFTTGDAVGEGAEKAGEAAARKALSKGAGRALGWLGIAGDVGEYGGKWILKQGDLAALDEAVEQNRVNLIDLYQAHIALSAQINDRLARIRKMDEIIRKDDQIYPEYAALRERQRLEATPATTGAKLDRETDEAGDAEELERYGADAARRGISTSNRPKVDPKPRPGVWGGSRRHRSRY